MSETDEIRLTRKEWEIVEDQCRDCKYWSNVRGCVFPLIPSPEPASDCLTFEQESTE